jgi:hypothetical protein
MNTRLWRHCNWLFVDHIVIHSRIKKFVTPNQIYVLFPRFLQRTLKQISIISYQILLTEHWRSSSHHIDCHITFAVQRFTDRDQQMLDQFPITWKLCSPHVIPLDKQCPHTHQFKPSELDYILRYEEQCPSYHKDVYSISWLKFTVWHLQK